MSHEHVYVDAIVGEATKQGTVTAVTVEVGELAPIPVEELKLALEFTKWQLNIITTPGVVQCKCGYTGAPVVTDKGHDYTIFHCPECKAELPAVLAGKDVVLKDVTVE